MSLPVSFQNELLRYLKNQFLSGPASQSSWNKKDTLYFSKGVSKLHGLFTRDRSSRHRDYFSDPVLRSGYLAYFFPVNLMKTLALLQTHLKTWTPPREIKVVDFGAGPLSLTAGLILFLKTHPKTPKHVSVEVTAYERNALAVKDGQAVLQNYLQSDSKGPQIDLVVHAKVGSFLKKRLTKKPVDFILAGNVLNEFDDRALQQRLVRSWLRLFYKPKQHLLFIEPGAKKTSRDLQALRDSILVSQSHHVLGPCTHQFECPLNRMAKRDWCHTQLTWKAPSFIQFFDKAIQLKKEYLQQSYLFLTTSKQRPGSAYDNRYMAISDVMRFGSRREVLGCGAAGRVRFVLEAEDRHVTNKSFEILRRGQYFKVSASLGQKPKSREQTFQLKRESRLQLCR